MKPETSTSNSTVDRLAVAPNDHPACPDLVGDPVAVTTKVDPDPEKKPS